MLIRFNEWFNENLDYIFKWLTDSIIVVFVLIIIVSIQWFVFAKLEVKKNISERQKNIFMSTIFNIPIVIIVYFLSFFRTLGVIYIALILMMDMVMFCDYIWKKIDSFRFRQLSEDISNFSI